MKYTKILSTIVFFSALFIGSLSASAAVVYSTPKSIPYCVGSSACPTVTITANPTAGIVGLVNPDLTWEATGNPTECHAGPTPTDWSGNNKPFVQSTPVSQGVLNTTRLYVYRLTCTYPPDALNPSGSTLTGVATVAVRDYECRDNGDNDSDTKIDKSDPGCHSDGVVTPWDETITYVPTDDSENDAPQCNDGNIDNDLDGLADINDPACHSDLNASNAGSYTPTKDTERLQCNDFDDNDSDGVADQKDTGCHTNGDASDATSFNPNDDNESSLPQCNDALDNDTDTKIDKFDPGCHTDGIVVVGNETLTYDSADDSEADSIPKPDLVAGDISPITVSRGVSTSFQAGITNQGNLTTGGTFSNIFQVTTVPGALPSNPSTTIVDLTPSLPANGTLGPLVANGGNGQILVSRTFNTVGTYYMRACADKDSASSSGVINESDENNNCHSWATITVSPPPTPSVTLNALSTQVFAGNSSALSWTSAYVSSCTATAVPASGSWNGSRPLASVPLSPESTGALTVTTTFTLSCTGAYGPASSSKKVTVVPVDPTAVLAELTVDDHSISPNDPIVLTWTSSGATSCTGINFNTAGWTNNVSGLTLNPGPGVNTTYTLSCHNAINSASDQETVTVKRKFWFIEF